VRRWYARYERLAMGPGETAAMYATMFDIFVRHILPAIRVPTLVLHRSGDRHVRVGRGRYLAGHIPAAKYVELRGRDNLFHVGDTETMLGEIRRGCARGDRACRAKSDRLRRGCERRFRRGGSSSASTQCPRRLARAATKADTSRGSA